MIQPYAPPAPAPKAVVERLVIHHLSDLHRGRTTGSRHPLETYGYHLVHLPPERQPNVIIITGDLTLTGSRDELHDAASEIRSLTMRWDDHARRQRIIIVPGPHDVDWAGADAKKGGLEAFTQEFGMFCIPLLIDREGRPLPGSEPYSLNSSEQFLVYAINTTYSPETPHPSPKAVEELVKTYRLTWKERLKGQARPGEPIDEGTRMQFLNSTEGLLFRDTGLVREVDIDKFARSIAALKLEEAAMGTSFPGDDQMNPLKILVTHHPLIAYSGRGGAMFPAALNAGPLLQRARQNGFHLMLHGHTHEPHALSDLPIDQPGVTRDVPLLQIGAGSLGGSAREPALFNELVATRTKGADSWSLDLTPVNLAKEGDRQPFHFALLSPTNAPSASRGANPSGEASAMRAKFDHHIRMSLRLLTEDVENDSQLQSDQIPLRPLDTIKDLIKNVLFEGIQTRVGLSLKMRLLDGSIVLQDKYIVPTVQMDEQYIHPFTYPDTLAAWALIQGDPLIYPRVAEDHAKVNYDWLRRSGKYDVIDRLLHDYGQRSANPARLADLRGKLENGTLTLADIYQPSPTVAVPTIYKSFISVPVPLRFSAAVAPRLREIGVLNVDVVDPDGNKPGEVFTDERVDMLRTISHVINVILTTADRLGKPRGSWLFQY